MIFILKTALLPFSQSGVGKILSHCFGSIWNPRSLIAISHHVGSSEWGGLECGHGESPIADRMFSTADGRIFGSFRAVDLRQMYHLPAEEKKYNTAFLEKFRAEKETESEPIRGWRQNLADHKHESSGKYSVDSLCSPYCYAGIMLCRLWGLHNSTNFTLEMVPLKEATCSGEIMDWADILSDKLAKAILNFIFNSRVTERFIPPFYYNAYVLDVLCFNSDFPMLGWR